MKSTLSFLCSQAGGNPAFLEGFDSLGTCPQLHPPPYTQTYREREKGPVASLPLRPNYWTPYPHRNKATLLPLKGTFPPAPMPDLCLLLGPLISSA